MLDEVLQLVAARALAITGADGVAIALAEATRSSATPQRENFAGLRSPARSKFRILRRMSGFESHSAVRRLRGGRTGRCSGLPPSGRPFHGGRTFVSSTDTSSDWWKLFPLKPYGFSDSDVRSSEPAGGIDSVCLEAGRRRPPGGDFSSRGGANRGPNGSI